MTRLYAAPNASPEVQDALDHINRREFSYVHVHCTAAFASVSLVILTPSRPEALAVAVAAIERDWPDRTIARVNDWIDTRRSDQLNVDVYPRTYVRDAVEKIIREPHQVYRADGRVLQPKTRSSTPEEV